MKTVKNISGEDLELEGIIIKPGRIVEVPDHLEHPALVEGAEENIEVKGDGRSAKAKKGK